MQLSTSVSSRPCRFFFGNPDSSSFDYFGRQSSRLLWTSANDRLESYRFCNMFGRWERGSQAGTSSHEGAQDSARAPGASSEGCWFWLERDQEDLATAGKDQRLTPSRAYHFVRIRSSFWLCCNEKLSAYDKLPSSPDFEALYQEKSDGQILSLCFVQSTDFEHSEYLIANAIHFYAACSNDDNIF